ncbi:metalloprotease PmbA [Nitrosomonas sp. HPC101]|uniref:metalloprotease PmbA n=1 Tax=Nitrosomonas sp. HPC101 TaxID=1658667 RepID=UPI00136C0679|nr:metalloprotease PmbA [Nitrosomonas sp. HPC101]MXS85075.1 metalloprotease PmbA [Nitrosomonas sp. HPC101]
MNNSNHHPELLQPFTYPYETLRQIANDVLTFAKKSGADACEMHISDGSGQNVTVRQGEVETIEYTRDKGLSVTVYIGYKRGNASSSDFSPQAIQETVSAALSIARYTADDIYAGLADQDLLATAFPDLDLYHPWPLPVEEAIELARQCEAAALATDKRITNSEGASISASASRFVYANSHGFNTGYPLSRHSISCAVIAGKQDNMQRDYWYSVARAARDLEAIEAVGRKAGMRTLARLGARKIATCEVPVLFESTLSSSLLGYFAKAISGSSLYRKSSFLLDSIGQQVFPATIQIRELPHLPKGLASCTFDDEGVATHPRKVVENGIVQGYFLGSYTARKLGMRSTGNAGGNHNLILENNVSLPFDALLKKMNNGLLVTELLGHGVNLVTGDYSQGAAGFWVENGEISHPVEEITIAGNLKEMLRGIAAVGNDVIVRGSRQCGSLLIEHMTIAGH